MQFRPEIFGSVIVAVGSFNPAIFSPDWLRSCNLIGSSDCDAAKEASNLLVARQACVVETDWFHLQVVDTQLNLTSKGVLTPAIRDLAQGILETVPHTPVSALGFNFFGHIKMPSDAEYHFIGDTLAPKDVWREIFNQEVFDVGLTDLQINVSRSKRGEIPDSLDRITIQLQPSTRIKTAVFLAINDHRADFSKDTSNARADAAARIVRNDWDAALFNAEQVFDKLLSKVLSKAK